MYGFIAGIEYYLPEKSITTSDLASTFPEWSIEKIDSRTGIQKRNIAAEHECASDLAVAAAEKLFQSGLCRREEIDYLLFCTQSPDYVLPTTACLLQERLGIPTSVGALDFNLGCSGFIYGLGLAEGLIHSKQADSVLLITAETYSKYLSRQDKSSRAIFGDGAAATWIKRHEHHPDLGGSFIYGTDGSGGKNLIVANSGARRTPTLSIHGDSGSGTYSEQQPLFMDGSKIFNFAVQTVPRVVRDLLDKADIKLNDIDLFIFHQANAYLLEEIRRILEIPREKFQLTLSHCGNTVSSTIPIALKHAELEGRLMKGDTIMLAGFGVGYSWAACLIQWAGLL